MQNRCHYNITAYLTIIFCSSTIFGITNAGAVDKESVANIKFELTWSDFDGEDYEIFYSSFKNNLWTPKVKITDNDFTDLIPSIGSGNNGITWLVWPAIKGSESHLFYSNYDGNRWSHPVQISTNLSANTSPSVIVDYDNVPWIVWAGFDGQDDDIYFTRWNGYDWDVPLRVNKDDSMPDILPIIGIDEEGNPWVQWSGYNGENYKKYFSKWNGTGWDGEIVINANNLYFQSTIENELYSIPELPAFLKEPDKASIHIKNGGQIQSIRLQNLKKKLLGYDDSNDDSNNGLNRDVVPASVEAFIGFGDSITQGVPYVNDPGDGRRVGGYEPKLEALLNGVSRPSYVLNYGDAGEDTSSGVNRIEGVLNGSNAKAILIMEGTNDFWSFSWQTTIQNLGIMIDKSHAKNVEPILATLTPDTRSNAAGKNIPTTYNPAIQSLSLTKGVSLADQYNAVIGNWAVLSDDGLHPNDAGYQVLAQIWFNTIIKYIGTGESKIWLMDGLSVAENSLTPVSDLKWTIAGAGDFNGDGKDDVVWRHASTGDVGMWLINGTTITFETIISTVSDLNWQIKGAGDFNGDWKSDILWRHASSGNVGMWFMNGGTITSGSIVATINDLNWQVKALGDFNDDGKSDILWRNN